MGNKISRNDLCSCGSGKKFKKCHGKVKQDDSPQLSNEYGIVRALSAYNKYELIRMLSSLLLIPANHSQNLRIEFALQAAMLGSNNKKAPKDAEIHQILNDYLPANGRIGLLEDPSENLFTENIEFTGGNYVVYSGITGNGSHILRSLLAATFLIENNLLHKFKSEVYQGVMLMLLLSDRIAKKAGHERYFNSNSLHRKQIDFLHSKDMKKLENAVTFSYTEVAEILSTYRISEDVLEQFITPFDTGQLKALNIEKNPLLNRPLVKISDKIIVAVPSSMIQAINHHIVSVAVKNNVLKELIDLQKEAYWAGVGRCLFGMGFEPLEVEIPTDNSTYFIKDILCEFDADKIAYVQLITDDGSGYDSNSVSISDNAQEISEYARKRKNTVIEFLRNIAEHKNKRIFYLSVNAGIGRDVAFLYDKLNGNDRSLVLTVNDLETLVDLRECDSLTLWKYADALRTFGEQTKVYSFSFLDQYKLYLDKSHSFYLDDNPKPKFYKVEIGGGKELREIACKTVDKHAVSYGNGKTITVRRKWKDYTFPVYYIDNAIYKNYELLIKGYNQPIWAKAGVNVSRVQSPLRDFYLEMNETIAYWLWQLTPSLSPYLALLGQAPIRVEFDFETPEKWADIEDVIIKDPNVNQQFQGEIMGERHIKIIIPDSIQPYLRSPDNDGERRILDFLLYSFAMLLKESNIESGMYEDEIGGMINTHAPLGVKKKIFIYHSKNNLLVDPHFLPYPRTIPEHDLEDQFDSIINELGTKCPELGEIESKNAKETLCDDVVGALYAKLIGLIHKFHWKQFMPMLIKNNEALLYKKHMWIIQSPTRIACFTGFDKHLEELFEENKEVGNANIISRILIEIVAAIQPTGEETLNVDDIDKMMAIISQILSWANMRNSIKFKLEDIKMGILPSGRIGTSKDFIEEVQNPFFKEKTREEIENSISAFTSNFDSPEKAESNDPDQQRSTPIDKDTLAEALKEEFGIALEELEHIYVSLANALIEFKTSSPNLRLSELVKYIQSKTPLSEETIISGIAYLTSGKRDDYLVPPDGYTVLDIYPWIYNRRLSYIRKPLIRIDDGEDPTFYWGPRHSLNSMWYLFNNVNDGRLNVTSSKLNSCLKTIQGYIGTPFTNAVHNWFSENIDDALYILDKNVKIEPGGKLNATEKKGDIDILLIDKKQKIIFLLECKNIKYARNAMEMYHEILDFTGKKNDPKSWINKHSERENWVNQNKTIVSDAYKTDLSEYSVKSYMVTPSDIPITFIKSVKLKIPFFSFMKLQREGISLL